MADSPASSEIDYRRLARVMYFNGLVLLGVVVAFYLFGSTEKLGVSSLAAVMFAVIGMTDLITSVIISKRFNRGKE